MDSRSRQCHEPDAVTWPPDSRVSVGRSFSESGRICHPHYTCIHLVGYEMVISWSEFDLFLLNEFYLKVHENYLFATVACNIKRPWILFYVLLFLSQVALAGLEVTLPSRLALNSQRSVCHVFSSRVLVLKVLTTILYCTLCSSRVSEPPKIDQMSAECQAIHNTGPLTQHCDLIVIIIFTVLILTCTLKALIIERIKSWSNTI